MKRKKSSAQAIALTHRPIWGKLSFSFFLLLSLSLIVISRTQPGLRAEISIPINDSFSPVLDVLSRPGEAMGRLEDWVSQTIALYHQNDSLRSDNARLVQWKKAAMQLQVENAALRNLLHYHAEDTLNFTTAKVISDRAGPAFRTVMINAGASQGIKEGQPVINDDGLVGRIVESGDHSARLMLITDINSRMPVMTETSRERTIAAGDNTDMLTLLYLPEDTHIKIGEKVVTSGDGDTVPAGLEVGQITSFKNGIAKVKPLSSWFRLEYVSIIAHQKP